MPGGRYDKEAKPFFRRLCALSGVNDTREVRDVYFAIMQDVVNQLNQRDFAIMPYFVYFVMRKRPARIVTGFSGPVPPKGKSPRTEYHVKAKKVVVARPSDRMKKRLNKVYDENGEVI